jgi:hypothetical protein
MDQIDNDDSKEDEARSVDDEIDRRLNSNIIIDDAWISDRSL